MHYSERPSTAMEQLAICQQRSIANACPGRNCQERRPRQTKLKEKKVGEKIEQKLNKAATKTAEGFKKAGDKIDQKLNH